MKTFFWNIIIILLVSVWYYIYTGPTNSFVEKFNDIQNSRIPAIQRIPATIDVSLTNTDRDINNLTIETKSLAEELIALAKDEWYYIFITEWLRTAERQQALYDQWRTQPWSVVTWTLNSRHLRGIAFDVAFETAYHWSAYPSDPAIREAVGELWESLWLIRWWRWRNPDMPHFQYGW